MKSSVFALIDCDSFFVSCERLFRPDLRDRPVVVLSSNDGCVISRSTEAKQLGIPMGAPAFKYKYQFRDHGVVSFSANFELYGDISERVIRVLTSVTPRTEVYSVDEAFLDLSELEIGDYTAWGHHVRRRLLREVGIPVSMGIAPTKTLAKLAREHAKKLGGVLDVQSLSPTERQLYLANTDISGVWGVGWRLTPRLRAESLHNALDLANMRPQYAQQLMGVHGRRLVAELNGQACIPLELQGRVRQSIMHGRMFGNDTSDFAVVEAAIVSLTARAAFGLRKSGLLARQASIMISTNHSLPGYQRQQPMLRLPRPTADTGLIASQLVGAAQAVFRPELRYHRANILLFDLISDQALQADMFGLIDLKASDQSNSRLQAVDQLNARYGKQTVRYAAENLSQAWQPKHNSRSPRYTTAWDELPVVKPLN